MDKEFISIKAGKYIKEIGKMIYKVDLEYKNF